MSLTSRTSFLVLMAHLKPQMYDALIPMGPKISEGTRHIMASMVIKSIVQEMNDDAVTGELQGIAKVLFETGAQSISYDQDDWYWGPHPRPNYTREFQRFGPRPEPWDALFGEEIMLNPQPLPPHERPYFGAILTLLADAVSAADVQEVLRKIGASLMETPSYEMNGSFA